MKIRKIEPIAKVTRMKPPTLDQRVEKYENSPITKDKEGKILDVRV
tara:strand:- start:238 stop:375 length:138 start_codon:yes stop_codon:yes gene_type:complete